MNEEVTSNPGISFDSIVVVVVVKCSTKISVVVVFVAMLGEVQFQFQIFCKAVRNGIDEDW